MIDSFLDFIFLFWSFFHCFQLGVLSLSPHFRCLSLLFFLFFGFFVCFSASQVALLCLPVFIGWTSVVGVLWDSMVQSLCYCWSGCSRAAHCSVHVDSLIVLALFLFAGSFVCGFFILGGLLVVTTPATSSVLWYTCCLIKQYYQKNKPMHSKKKPYHSCNINNNWGKFTKVGKRLRIRGNREYEMTKRGKMILNVKREN